MPRLLASLPALLFAERKGNGRQQPEAGSLFVVAENRKPSGRLASPEGLFEKG